MAPVVTEARQERVAGRARLRHRPASPDARSGARAVRHQAGPRPRHHAAATRRSTRLPRAVLTGLGAVLDEVTARSRAGAGRHDHDAGRGARGLLSHASPVGHVEAGLRIGHRCSPWPEEMNRRVADAGDAAFTSRRPSARASNLLAEGSRRRPHPRHRQHGHRRAARRPSRGIARRRKRAAEFARQFPFLDPARRMVLVTGHRRENFGGGFENICRALRETRRAARRADRLSRAPQSQRPGAGRAPARRIAPDVHLIDPLDYLPFVYLMERSHLIITDSGGVQEEAPSLGKPVLVMRETTERPEAVEAGTVVLVGTDARQDRRARRARLLTTTATIARMAQRHNPYGDGHAAASAFANVRRS